MKLISLNTWGGKKREPLMGFLKEHAPTTDIFCFQEIPHTAAGDRDKAVQEFGDTWFEDLQKALPDFEGYFDDTHVGFNQRQVDFELLFGNAMFVRKGIEVVEVGHSFVYRNRNEVDMAQLANSNWFSLPRLIQHVKIRNTEGQETVVVNFHGMWHEGGKGDMPERIEQSQKILQFMNKVPERKILCGDFNLNIDNQSLSMLEIGMRNLIKEFGITTTRSKEHYPKIERMPYADYTLVSPDIEVTHFSVPDLPISDHLPMILEFV